MNQQSHSLCRLSVYLKGDDLCPDEITKLVGIEPTEGRRKGEAWITSSNKTVVEKRGLWSWTYSVQTDDVAQVLERFLVMFPEGISFGKLPGVTDAYLDIFVANKADESGGGEGDLILDPLSLRRLAMLELPLQVTFAVVCD